MQARVNGGGEDDLGDDAVQRAILRRGILDREDYLLGTGLVDASVVVAAIDGTIFLLLLPRDHCARRRRRRKNKKK